MYTLCRTVVPCRCMCLHHCHVTWVMFVVTYWNSSYYESDSRITVHHLMFVFNGRIIRPVVYIDSWAVTIEPCITQLAKWLYTGMHCRANEKRNRGHYAVYLRVVSVECRYTGYCYCVSASWLVMLMSVHNRHLTWIGSGWLAHRDIKAQSWHVTHWIATVACYCCCTEHCQLRLTHRQHYRCNWANDLIEALACSRPHTHTHTETGLPAIKAWRSIAVRDSFNVASWLAYNSLSLTNSRLPVPVCDNARWCIKVPYVIIYC